MNRSLSHLDRQTLDAVSWDAATSEWGFQFSARVVLQVSSPWRSVSRGLIALGWQDDGQAFGLPNPISSQARLTSLLVGKQVKATSLGPCGDLVIRFDNSSAIEVFNASCGYEGWHLFGPGDRWVVAQGDGNVAESGDDG